MALLQDPLLDQEIDHSGTTKPRFEVWKEVKMQLVIAGPMMFVNLLQFLLHIISLMFVGHLGKLSLSSASLASASCNVSGFNVMLGMAAALETLCGQAFGAKQYTMVGIHLQRAIIVQLITSLPISILWFYMGHVLRAIGQDPIISVHAQAYARCLIPALFVYAVQQPLIKFLQTQSLVLPMALCAIASLCVHIPLCWLLLYKLQFGSPGAALSVGASNLVSCLCLATYVKLSKSCKLTWGGFSTQAFRGFKGYSKLAAPAAIMICLETWAFEIATLVSGLLPNPQLETSAFSSVFNSVELCYMITLGLSAASSTRAANELGAGNPLAAKAAVGVTICMGIIDSAFVVTLLLSFRKIIGYAFSSEKDVVDHTANLFKAAVFIAAFDPIQGVLTGVARGCGWQAIGAGANLLAFYVVGLPIAVTLAFRFKLYGLGLWIGIACGNATQTLVLCLITFFTNWQKQAEVARMRLTILN